MSFVVTIDGPAAAGKSTTARGVASRLGFLYVDTGALYRAIALKVQQGGIPPDDREAVARVAGETQVALSGAPDHPRVWLDGAEVSDEIRTPEVSELSSRLAAQASVRGRLVEIQRGLRERGPLVAEGRDLGTVVFPDAEVKVYLDADLDMRARRRFRERERLGLPMTLDDVREELSRRDERDRGRQESPLAVPADARVLDTSGMSIEDQVEAVLAVIEAHPRFPARRGGGAGPRGPSPVPERSDGGTGD